MKPKIKIPLIKEYRIEKLLSVMECFYNHPFDRDAIRECVLKLYKDKDEKSIFRGMVIPSLRHLGLILGYEEDLRLSTNGNIIVTAGKRSNKEEIRAFRAVLTEKDDTETRILRLLDKKILVTDSLKQLLIQRIEAPSEKQAKERFNHWISMLSNLGLVKKSDDGIEIVKDVLLRAREDLYAGKKAEKFVRVFFDCYKLIFKKRENVSIVDIEELRTEVARSFYENEMVILTEKQFDVLLRKVPFATDQYIISLGRAMGAEEKLFRYENNYYRTISIRFLNEGG